jgi:hypothetical protein
LPPKSAGIIKQVRLDVSGEMLEDPGLEIQVVPSQQ